MDGNYPPPRNRPNGSAGGRRPSMEGRRPPGTPGGPVMSPSAPVLGSPPAGGMTRAERFEDERRRITESLFSKTDPNGSLAESYITHIRIQEDSQYPQNPPPPDSSPNNKKPRIILVSVKSSGRVRMHKARENPNGSFSIGKTWNMEDLTSVETFTNANPTNEEEAKRKEWARDVGFIVTVAKPYYWEAGTAKEKEFFIGSLVKIFRKYTQGKVPELIGFTAREADALLGPAGALAPRPPGQQQRPGPPPRPGQQPSPNRGYPPGSSPEPGLPGAQRPPPIPRSRPGTGDDVRRPPPIRDLSSQGQQQNAPYFGARDPSRQPRPQPSMERGMRQQPSREQMRPPPNQRGRGPAPSFSSSQRLTPQSSWSEASQRPTTPDSGVNSLPPSLMPNQSPRRRPSPSSDGKRSMEEPRLEDSGLGISAPERRRPLPNGNVPPMRREPSPRGLRPGTAQSNGSSVISRNEDLSADDRPRNTPPPERRRPQMPSTSSSQSQRSFGNESTEEFSTPMQTPPVPASRPTTRGTTEGKPDRAPGTFIDESNSPEVLPIRTFEAPQPPPQTPVPEVPKRAKEPKPPPPEIPAPVVEPEPAPTVQPPSPREEEVSRPGLGPMVKKKPPTEVADVLRKAAFAYNAFKPRAGGAGEKLLLKDEQKTSKEADGISGVFKAPAKPVVKEEQVEPDKPPIPERLSREVPKINTGGSVPSVTVSSPVSAGPPQPPSETIAQAKPRSPSPEKAKSAAETEIQLRRQKRRSNHDVKLLSKLGIDPSILDGRGLDFETILVGFGWGSSELQPKKVDALETDLRRELGRAEAGSWLGHLEQKDDRVEAVEGMLDRAIAECDELEGLLTLYNVELSSLNDDIAFIEAQGQGLQVQTANQKLLQTELNQLVTTISITPDQLEPLRRARIGKPDGLDAIESSLLLLYKAMVTIDPALAQGSRASAVEDPSKFTNTHGFGNSELATMRALQEKRDRYITESTLFLDRLKSHMQVTFGAALLDTEEAISKRTGGGSQLLTKLDVGVHDLARNALWKYSPLLLFAKEVDESSWNQLIAAYQLSAGAIYKKEIVDNATAWKKIARKPTGDEQDLLFTSQEKEPESIAGMAGAARKLTVKRSQTLARGLRSTSGDKEAKSEKVQKGRLYPFETFAGFLNEMSPLVFTEQNFVTEFFHATSSENIDFPDAVIAAPPDGRHGTNLFARKLYEPDRAMAKRVAEIMSDMFTGWEDAMKSMIAWAVEVDPLQGVGILCAIDRKILELEDTNQDFIMNTLRAVQGVLSTMFSTFVAKQILAIEDTKVKIKKRKGVIAFMKTFPHFSFTIENMLPLADDPEKLEVRSMVDDAYDRINKAMFGSLKVIAKDSAAGVAAQGQGDPEDKEALNYHILLIENMNHYIEEVDERGDIVLREWRDKAVDMMTEHMALYVDAVIRRPMGKLLEFLESTESLLASLPSGTPPTSLAARSSHSRPLFKKLVSAHDGKELRRGIEALKKRVDKHYGDADDPGLSRNLVANVLKECERMYEDVWRRAVKVNQDVYEGEVEMEWRMEDVAAAFRK